MKLLRRILVGLSLLVCMAALVLGWLACTDAGTRALVRLATGSLGDKFAVQDVRGTLTRELGFGSLRYRDPAAGIDLRLDRGRVTIMTGALLGGRLRVTNAGLEGLVVDLFPAPPVTAQPALRSPVRLPIGIEVDVLTLDRAELRTGGTTALALDRVELAGSWTDRGIDVRRLRVLAREGEATVSGHVDGQHTLAGGAEGNFDLRLGEQSVRGTLTAAGDGRTVTLRSELSAPLAATVAAEIAQRADAAWQISVEVPAFDPRTWLLPDSGVGSLGVTLEGHGDRSSAEAQATIAIDGEQLHVDGARLRLDGDILRVDALSLRLGAQPGSLHATGTIALHETPLRAAADLEWSDVTVPAKWAGRDLVTHGRATIAGNATRFDSAGEMTIGPAGRAAELSWSVSGSPAELEIQRLEAREKSGRLTATGTLGLVPYPSWQLDAEASDFDPGAFVAAWPGSLNFALVTDGVLDPEARHLTLRLSGLSGTLRGRPVSGDGELTLSREMLLAGTLALRSGESTLRIAGKREESLDVTADLDVASLSDLRADLAGRVSAHARATGRWPALRIEGSAQGADLTVAGERIGAATLSVSMRDAQKLDGELLLETRDVALRGFAFNEARLQASGRDARHAVSLRAQGSPLSTALEVRGAYDRGTWSGTLEDFSLEVEQLPRLRLQAPVQATFAPPTFDVSELCVAGADVGLCASGRRERSGAVEAQYAIRHLPLSLLARLAMPDRPLSVAGTIEGGGNVRRAANGSYSGAGRLSSTAGHIAQSDEISAVRLDYEDLTVDSSFENDSARFELRAGLPGQGDLSGDIALANLVSGNPSLSGSAKAGLRDLSPLVLLLPQLATVHGAGEVAGTIEGTLREPRLAGTLRVSAFDTELPVLGLHLERGSLSVDAQSGKGVQISGAVSSGEGRIDLSGSGGASVLDLRAEGKDFLAANVPAARIVVSPELELEGKLKALALTGRVVVPSANVDLDKLTAGGAQRASPDVVVVDRETTADERAIELRTDVTIVLGEDVKLVGLGLDATAEGELRIRETPGEPSLAAGEIRLQGTYEAYGRKLEIERGLLQYASVPLDDPQLDLLAVRKLRDVTAKLRVTGTAKRPELTVFADPAMSSTDALSYLINGKPSDELRSDESARMQSAAQSLGSIVVGNRLTKNLGERFGISDVGVQQNAAVGSAFTVGTYLSPRFYVSYGVGLFEPGQVMTLRYELSDKLSLEANQAPEDQHAGIYYRLER
jgi:translocation and assembly module TamB